MRPERLPNYQDLLYEALTHLKDQEGLSNRDIALLMGVTDSTKKAGDESKAQFRRLMFPNGNDGAVWKNEAKEYEKNLIEHWKGRLEGPTTGLLNEVYSVISNRLQKRTNAELDCLALTSINWDTILEVDELGDKVEDFDEYTTGVSNHPGGAGVNTASMLADCGKRCGIVGCVASDIQSTHIVERLVSRGLSASFIQTISVQQGLTCGSTSILSLKGKRVRHIYRARGANHYFGSEFSRPSEELKEALADCPCVIVTNLNVNSHRAISALMEYVPADAVVVLRIDSATSLMRFQECADIFARANVVYTYAGLLRRFVQIDSTPNSMEVDSLLGCYLSMRAETSESALQPQLVVVKNDSQRVREGEAEYVAGGQWLSSDYPNYITSKLVASEALDFADSTGEGDAFIAGFLLCASNKDVDGNSYEQEFSALENSLLLATSASLYCGTQIGGAPLMPSIEELVKFRRLAFGV